MERLRQKQHDEYCKRMIQGFLYPIVFCRTTAEDAEKYSNRILRKGVLCAEVKSYADWSEPKWKMGDGERSFKDLPYCSGPPSVVIEGCYPPFKDREENA